MWEPNFGPPGAKVIAVAKAPVSHYAVQACMTRGGYTKARGAPTDWMIMVEGEKRWRRVRVSQSSNAGTLFVVVRGVFHVVNPHDLDR